jgi:hypothetical protein
MEEFGIRQTKTRNKNESRKTMFVESQIDYEESVTEKLDDENPRLGDGMCENLKFQSWSFRDESSIPMLGFR